MNDAIVRMLDRYQCRSVEDYVNALREILQEVALLGLWRSKFFEFEPVLPRGDAEDRADLK